MVKIYYYLCNGVDVEIGMGRIGWWQILFDFSVPFMKGYNFFFQIYVEDPFTNE